jgi:hypothetical protein
MMRALGLTVLLIMVGAVILWMRPGSTPRPRPPVAVPVQFAPLVPAGETPAPADEAFRDACFKSLQALIVNWTLSDLLFTQSTEWGLVLRADYTSPDQPASTVNRVVCSKNTDGKMRVNVTMGQKLPPLNPAAK